MYRKSGQGFTLIELLVAVSIIALLSSVIFASFMAGRSAARDTDRQVALKELQLALDQYRGEFGRYPEQGCDGLTTWTGPGPHSASWGNASDCNVWVTGVVPGILDRLPMDVNDEEDNVGFLYQTNTSGTAFKLMSYGAVEAKFISSYEQEFARCPSSCGTPECGATPPDNVYAVYSRGAECW